MGLFTGDFRFLLSAKRMGLQGNTACTIGSQPLFFSERTMDRIAGECGQDLSALPRGKAIYATHDVLRTLGFSQVDIVDISDYEGANVLQDLNLPIPPRLNERYDLIVDGGTLEHVFNFPMAIENIMRMTKVGGEVLLFSPSNNYCGHGFYQLSPELYFRVFSPDNGFEMRRIYVNCGNRYYHVADPVDVHGRVELTNSRMALLMVHARKIARVPEKLQPPQQSDYVTTWAERAEENRIEQKDSPLKAFLRARLSPQTVAKISEWRFQVQLMREAWRVNRRARLSNRKLYRPVTRWDVTTREAFGR